MTNPDQPPAKRRAFSYTEMMNSGQQQLSAEQIAALEKQTKKSPSKTTTQQQQNPDQSQGFVDLLDAHLWWAVDHQPAGAITGMGWAYTGCW